MSDTLADLQSAFQDYILGHSNRALGRVESTDTLSAERRLDIYHIAYRLRLVDVLADTYERVARYIGEESFDTAARAFIEKHPSGTRNLRDYGIAFPAFLANYYSNDAEVAELAEMDARLRYAFDAQDADAISMADVAAAQPSDWDAVVFTLHPTVSFQVFRWNTPAIWTNVSDDEAPPPATPLAEPMTWLFWRKELQPHFRSLNAEEYAALQAIQNRQTFGDICSLLAESFPELDVTTQIAVWLRTWLDDGVLSAVDTGNR